MKQAINVNPVLAVTALSGREAVSFEIHFAYDRLFAIPSKPLATCSVAIQGRSRMHLSG